MKKLQRFILRNTVQVFWQIKSHSYSLLVIVCLIPGLSISLLTNSYPHDGKTDDTKWRESAIKVFLDLLIYDRNYSEYIKTEIPFVNYVRDTKQSQVHIMVTTQRTGGSGTEYTLTFLGQQNFVNVNDTLKYVSGPSDTEEMTRSGVVRAIKLGLMPYVAKTPLADDISISFSRKITQSDPSSINDKWNYWVFSMRLGGDFDGESQKKGARLDGSLTANQVTPAWKLSFNASTNYEEDRWNTQYYKKTNIKRNHSFRGLIVKSLDEHWSIGCYLSANSSTYSNTKLSVGGAPALEYNIIPYSESTRREFRFLYRIGYEQVHYEEITLYDKLKENVFNESIKAIFEKKEKWGTITSSLEYSHYFHDFSKKKISLSGWLSLRLFEGVSLTLNGSISKINDQLDVPARNLDEDEILLQRRKLATDYDYRTRIGITYTFGSIYSNVVNPRMGETDRRSFF